MRDWEPRLAFGQGLVLRCNPTVGGWCMQPDIEARIRWETGSGCVRRRRPSPLAHAIVCSVVTTVGRDQGMLEGQSWHAQGQE